GEAGPRAGGGPPRASGGSPPRRRRAPGGAGGTRLAHAVSGAGWRGRRSWWSRRSIPKGGRVYHVPSAELKPLSRGRCTAAVYNERDEDRGHRPRQQLLSYGNRGKPFWGLPRHRSREGDGAARRTHP